ncbi:MAG: hypothetical protein WC955_11215 [Elusimicrobiota bacterium]
MNKSIVIGSIIIIISISIAFGYFYWLHTPAYSLTQVAKAAKIHDVRMFNMYVDVNTVVNRVLENGVSTTTYKSKPEETSQWSKLVESIREPFLKLMVPRLDEIMKEQIEQYIKTGVFVQDQEGRNGKDNGCFQEFKKYADSKYTGIKYTKNKGKIALVGIGLVTLQDKKKYILELKMQKMKAGYWQLIEIVNITQKNR